MAEAPPKKTSKRKGKGKAEMPPIDRPKRKKTERQRLTVTSEPAWSYKDKEKLIEALHRYAPSAVESIANVIGNKTAKQVEQMINRTVNSACFSKDDRRVELDPEKGAAPLELWLSLVHELVKADKKTDHSASYSKVLDVIARNEKLPEDSGFPNLCWSNLYCYIGDLLDDKAVQQPLSHIESLVMLDMMHNLGDTLHTSDTREQRKLLDLKYQLYRRQAETMGGEFTSGLNAFHNDFTDVKYTTSTTATTTTDGAEQSTAAATQSSSSTTSETPVTLTFSSSSSSSTLPPSTSSSSSFVVHQPSTSSNSDLSSNPHQEEEPSTSSLTLDPHINLAHSSSSQTSSQNQRVSEFENAASSSASATKEQTQNSSSSDSSSFIPTTSHHTMKPPPPARASTSGVGPSKNNIAGSSSSSIYQDDDVDDNNDDDEGGFSLPEFFSLNPLTIPAHLLSFKPKNVTIDEEDIPVVIDIKKQWH